MLTTKEVEVLKLRKQGFKQKEIAQKLNISQPAVSHFEKNALKKIQESEDLLNFLKKEKLENKNMVIKIPKK